MQAEMTRAWIEIDLGALQRNAAEMARRAAVPLLPMVKADAYGLGAVPVARALDTLQPWAFGVATVPEGAELRRAGIDRPVLVFTPLLADEFGSVRAHNLVPTLGSAAQIRQWVESGGGRWHLAIDTGMNRAGVPWDRIGEVSELVRSHPPEGAFTHFHSADADDGSVAVQERRFESVLKALPVRPLHLHAENSPSLERRGPSPWTLARPGVFLYGVGGGAGASLRPEPVAHLRARVVEVREVAAGETVSYSATWRAAEPCRIATVAAGYADGVRRSLSNRGVALVRGCRAPIAGLVTMDMTMLDVTGTSCEVGDTATFLGRDGEALLDISDVAASAGLSPYEMLVGLRLRAKRIYVA
jgi:alanine racemase